MASIAGSRSRATSAVVTRTMRFSSAPVEYDRNRSIFRHGSAYAEQIVLHKARPLTRIHPAIRVIRSESLGARLVAPVAEAQFALLLSGERCTVVAGSVAGALTHDLH